MMGDNKEKNQEQGKKATAEADMTYNRDGAGLKNSAPNYMADFDSGGSVGAGGVG